MLVFVYGTLKEGYGNNYLLSSSEKVSSGVMEGYKLYDCGFPIAVKSDGDFISGEVYDIGDDAMVLNRLDRLESEGSMYNRVDNFGTSLYVGGEDYWDLDNLQICPQDPENGAYVWEGSTW